MRVIIIDDEQQSHKALTTQLQKNHPNIQIIGQAYNVEEGYKTILKMVMLSTY